LAIDAEISSNYRSPLSYAAEQQRNPASESNLTDANLPNPFKRTPDIDRDTATTPTIEAADYGTPGGDIRNYSTLSYSKIPKKGKVAEQGGFNDFRLDVTEYDGSTGFLGDRTNSNYKQKNLEKSGWGTQGKVGEDRSDYTKASGRGDKVNLIDYEKRILSAEFAKGDYSEITPNTKDFIAFYFSGPLHHLESEDDMIVFRANIQGFADSFSPEWATIPIMGRADKAYIYTGFERSISFTFTVAATSREELKPMWRKINYLSTYTMPDYSNGRLVGPFMRITIGNLFQNTPVFIESLNVSIPDEATWELNSEGKSDVRQLPTMAEISVTLKYLGDYRPKKIGRAYSLSKFGQEKTDSDNWLSEAE